MVSPPKARLRSLVTRVQVPRPKGHPHRVGETMTGVGVRNASLVRKRGYREQVYLWMYECTARIEGRMQRRCDGNPKRGDRNPKSAHGMRRDWKEAFSGSGCSRYAFRVHARGRFASVLTTAPCAHDGKGASEQRKTAESQARIDFRRLGRIRGFLRWAARLVRSGPSIGDLIARLGNEHQRQHGGSEEGHHVQHPLQQLRTGNETSKRRVSTELPETSVWSATVGLKHLSRDQERMAATHPRTFDSLSFGSASPPAFVTKGAGLRGPERATAPERIEWVTS
jgi:hypothetical protein